MSVLLESRKRGRKRIEWIVQLQTEPTEMPDIPSKQYTIMASRGRGNGKIGKARRKRPAPSPIGQRTQYPRDSQINRQNPPAIKMRHDIKPRRQAISLARRTLAPGFRDAVRHLRNGNDRQKQQVAVAVHPRR